MARSPRHPSAFRIVPLSAVPVPEPLVDTPDAEVVPQPPVQVTLSSDALVQTVAELQAAVAEMRGALAEMVAHASTVAQAPTTAEAPPPLAAAVGPTPSEIQILTLLEEIRRTLAAPRTRTVERNASGEITVVHEQIGR